MTSISGASSPVVSGLSTTTTGVAADAVLLESDGAIQARSTFDAGPTATLGFGDQVFDVVSGEVRVEGKTVGRLDDAGHYEITLGGQSLSGNVGDLLGATLEGHLSTGEAVNSGVALGSLALGGDSFVVVDGQIYEFVQGGRGERVGSLNDSGQLRLRRGDETVAGTLGVDGLETELTTVDTSTLDGTETAQLTRVMRAVPALTAQLINAYRAAFPDAWRGVLVRLDALVTRAQGLGLSGSAVAALVHASTSGLEIPSGDDALKTLASRVSDALDVAKTHGLSDVQTQQLVNVMVGNAALTKTKLQETISARGDAWTDDLSRLDAAETALETLGLGEAARSSVTRALLEDRSLTAVDVVALARAHPGGELAHLDRLAVATTFQLSGAERARLDRVMDADASLTPERVNALFEARPEAARLELFTLDTRRAAEMLATQYQLTPAAAALVTQWMLANPLLPEGAMRDFLEGHDSASMESTLGRISAANSFAEANALPPEQWDAVVRVMAGDSTLTSAQLTAYRASAGTQWPEVLGQLDAAQSVSTLLQLEGSDAQMMRNLLLFVPGSDALGVLAFVEGHPSDWKAQLRTMARDAEFAATSWNPTGPRDADAPGTPSYVANPARMRFRLHETPVTERDTTGDTRNKDLPHLGDFTERYLNFGYDVGGGVNYRDASADVVRRMNTPTYLARQLSDQAKQLGYSFQNKAGDTAAQLGVYLDMIGVKDVSRLRVIDGRVVDTTTSKDLGAYDPDQAFAYTAVGDGWTDFYAKKLDTDQVILVPHWGDSSDAKKIVAVVGVALAFTGVGAALGGSILSSAGASSAFLASTTGGIVSGALGSAVISTAVGGLAGQNVSLTSFAKTFATSVISQSITTGVSKVMGGLDVGGVKLGEHWAGQALIKGVGGGLSTAVQGGDFKDGFVSGATSSLVSSGTSALLTSETLDLGWSQESVAGASAFLGAYLSNGRDLGNALVAGAGAYLDASTRPTRTVSDSPSTVDDVAAEPGSISRDWLGSLRFGDSGTSTVRLGTGDDGGGLWSDATVEAPGPVNLRALENAMLPQTRVVRPGDTLSGIAQQLLGDANRWPEVYAYNASKLSANPNQLRVGVELDIPPADFQLPDDIRNRLHRAAYVPPAVLQAPVVDPLLAADLPFDAGAFLGGNASNTFGFFSVLPPSGTRITSDTTPERGLLQTLANSTVNTGRMVAASVTDAATMSVELAKMALPWTEANRTFRYILQEELGPWLGEKLSAPQDTARQLGGAFERAVQRTVGTVADPSQWGDAISKAWDMVTGGAARLAETLAEDPSAVTRDVLVQRGNDAIQGLALVAGLKGLGQVMLDGALAANGAQVTVRGLMTSSAAATEGLVGVTATEAPVARTTSGVDNVQLYRQGASDPVPHGMMIHELVPAGATQPLLVIEREIAAAKPLDQLLYDTFNQSRMSGVTLSITDQAGAGTRVVNGRAVVTAERATIDYARFADDFEVVGLDAGSTSMLNHEIRGHASNMTRAASSPEMPMTMGVVGDARFPASYERLAALDEVQAYNITAASNRDLYLSAMRSGDRTVAAQGLDMMQADLQQAQAMAAAHARAFGAAMTPENLALVRETLKDANASALAGTRRMEFQLVDADGVKLTMRTAVPLATEGNPELAFAYVRAQLSQTRYVLESERATTALLERDLSAMRAHAEATAPPPGSAPTTLTPLNRTASVAQVTIAAQMADAVLDELSSDQRAQWGTTLRATLGEQAVATSDALARRGASFSDFAQSLGSFVKTLATSTPAELTQAVRDWLQPPPAPPISEVTARAVPGLASALSLATTGTTEEVAAQADELVLSLGGTVPPELRMALLTSGADVGRALQNAQTLIDGQFRTFARALAAVGLLAQLSPAAIVELMNSAESPLGLIPSPQLLEALRGGAPAVRVYFDTLRTQGEAVRQTAEHASQLRTELGLPADFPMHLWNLDALTAFEQAPTSLLEDLRSPQSAVSIELARTPAIRQDPGLAQAFVRRFSLNEDPVDPYWN